MSEKRAKGFRRSQKEWEETLASHIGKFFDNANAKDLVDAGIVLGCAIMGYQATSSPIGALVGAVGYKLATTMGGTPPASQIAGLSILGTLGLIGVTFSEERIKAIEETKIIAAAPEADRPFYSEWVTAQVTGSTLKGYCEWMRDYHPDIQPKVCEGP